MHENEREQKVISCVFLTGKHHIMFEMLQVYYNSIENLKVNGTWQRSWGGLGVDAKDRS
jgi:hypothetical protein